MCFITKQGKNAVAKMFFWLKLPNWPSLAPIQKSCDYHSGRGLIISIAVRNLVPIVIILYELILHLRHS